MPIPADSTEQRLRDALQALLENLGALPTYGKITDEDLIRIANEYVPPTRLPDDPLIDMDIPF